MKCPEEENRSDVQVKYANYRPMMWQFEYLMIFNILVCAVAYSQWLSSILTTTVLIRLSCFALYIYTITRLIIYSCRLQLCEMRMHIRAVLMDIAMMKQANEKTLNIGMVRQPLVVSFINALYLCQWIHWSRQQSPPIGPAADVRPRHH